MSWRAWSLSVMLVLALLTACAGAGSSGGNRPRTPAPTASTPGQAVMTRLKYRYLTDLSDGSTGREYGYNLVDLGPDRAAIDALPAGVRALVWMGDYDSANCSFARPDASLQQVLAPLAGDPKVAGYYVADEADDALAAYGGHCPDVVARIAQRSRLIHRLAPGAFTYEVVTEPGNFAAFARATDVLGADPYPCLRGRRCDWNEIPAYIAALDAAHVPRYWACLQAFGYRNWRAPTAAELSRMIGQWERSRWQGEQTFAWKYPGWSLSAHPGLLTVLENLNSGLPGRRVPPGLRA